MNTSFWNGIDQSRVNDRFVPQIRKNAPELPRLPRGIIAKLATTDEDLKETREFLEKNFGDPPRTPKFSPDLVKTAKEQIVIILEDKSNNNKIIGSIRFKYSGHFEKKQVSVIDCFCISAEYRKTGLGTYLLAALHKLTNEMGLKYSLFLKESAPVWTFRQPIYSSSYLFKKVMKKDENEHSNLKSTIKKLSHQDALRLIEIYREIYPDTFILINTKSTDNTRNLEWRLWHDWGHFILACFQNSYQTIDDKSIGWCTGWLESSYQNIDSKTRSKIIDSMIHTLSYNYIWADATYIKDADGWGKDGPFHWYTYQWSTNMRILSSYVLTI